MSKFEDAIVQLGLREAEKMNTCHSPSTGQFCSGGGGGGKVTPPAHLGNFEKNIYTQLASGQISHMTAVNYLVTRVGYNRTSAAREVEKWGISKP